MKKFKIQYLVISIFLFFIGFILFGLNNTLEISKYNYTNKKIPEEFDGYKIVQISDFHCKEFGEHESELIDAIKNLEPDLIVLTGDMINQDNPDISNTSLLLTGIYSLCPIYSVNGNHELSNLDAYYELKKIYKALGIIELNDSNVSIYKDNKFINILGMEYYNQSSPLSLNYLSDKIVDSTLNILLFHGSDTFNQLSYYNYDLIFSGHTHGGLIRIPFLGGLIGNDMTLFPLYDGGIFLKNDTTLISSRGLGDSIIPRFYNRPELVMITLKSAQ